jgi:hypothetical protein
LLLVALVFLLPFVLAVILRFGGWQPTQTRNFGKLLDPPQSMQAVRAERADGSAWVFENQDHHWTLLLRRPAHCDAACVAAIAPLPNVRASMGRHQGRMSMFEWVAPGASPAAGFDALALQGSLPDALQAEPAGAEVWMIDPHGYLVLHYPAGFEARELRLDLGRLIK